MKTKEEMFDRFGYDSSLPCAVCGKNPTKSEPRFGYSVCIDCFGIPPVEISELRDKKKWKKKK